MYLIYRFLSPFIAKLEVPSPLTRCFPPCASTPISTNQHPATPTNTQPTHRKTQRNLLTINIPAQKHLKNVFFINTLTLTFAAGRPRFPHFPYKTTQKAPPFPRFPLISIVYISPEIPPPAGPTLAFLCGLRVLCALCVNLPSAVPLGIWTTFREANVSYGAANSWRARVANLAAFLFPLAIVLRTPYFPRSRRFGVRAQPL